MPVSSETEPKTLWDALAHEHSKYSDLALPKVSIIMPTLNCAESLPITLESILIQDYPDYELIVIDGGSKDRTLQVLKSYDMEKVRLYSVSHFDRYEMLNKGISHANGLYVNFLFPGDYYIHYQTIKRVIELALDHGRPHLVHGGCVLHEANTNIKILNRPLSLELLKKGRQPTSLQSCWFRMDTFRKIGKFSTKYALRGGYDLLCRFCLHPDLDAVFTRKVLSDYDLRGIQRNMVIMHFWETFKLIYQRFGVAALVRWLLFEQKDVARYLKLWFRSFKGALFGR